VTLYGKGEAVGMNYYDTESYGGGRKYLGKDVMGSVWGVTDDYGVLGDRYEYDVFGEVYEGDLGGGMNLGYTGKPYDVVTGMYNYGYRDYKAEAGRFTTEDPIRDGNNWYAYVNNDPVNWVDLWGLDKNLIIYNTDPTPGSDKIISGSGNVGHTWMNIGGKSYGWGYSGQKDPDSGDTVPGALLETESENRQKGEHTSSYTKTITDEQAEALENYWNGLKSAGTGYNLGGRAYDQGATMCTEAVIEALNTTGVLTPAESSIVNGPYNQWGNSIPNPPPAGYEDAKDKFNDLTSPNPNEFENRVNQLNNKGH
jgi:RHS repeat-associated protein